MSTKTKKVTNPIDAAREDYYQEWRQSRFLELASMVTGYAQEEVPHLFQSRDSQYELAELMMEWIESPNPFHYTDVSELAKSKKDEDEVYDP